MSEEGKSFDIKQELETLVSAVDKAAQARLGSYSQRNPLAGKMVRCPHCRQRKRQNETCCIPKYTQKTDSYIPKQRGRKNPRLTRHRPPLFLMRQRLLELEANPELIGPLQDRAEGQVHGKNSTWGHTPQKQVKMEHLAAFVERFILRELKLSAKRKRKQQKESRRINRK